MMEISWDCVLPTQEQWDVLEGRAFECLEDIKGAQMAISTRAMLELWNYYAAWGTPRPHLQTS